MILDRLSKWIAAKVDASLDWLMSVWTIEISRTPRQAFENDLLPLDFAERKNLILELIATFEPIDILLAEYGTPDLRMKLQRHINRALAALDDEG
jgi:hypothetical protein